MSNSRFILVALSGVLVLPVTALLKAIKPSETAIRVALTCLTNLAAWIGLILGLHDTLTNLFVAACVLIDMFCVGYLLKKTTT